MAIKNEFMSGGHPLIQHYVYLLDIFHHLYSQKLPKGNVMYNLIQQDVKHQLNIQDISVRNAMLDNA